MFILMFSVAVVGLMGCAMRAQEFAGKYTVSTPAGLIHLSLRQAEADALSGTLVLPSGVAFQARGAVAVDSEGGSVSVEGTLARPQERGAFILESPDEDGNYYLVIIPHDVSGTPRLDQLAGYLVQRDEDVKSPDHHLQSDFGNAVEHPPPLEDVDRQADGTLRDPRLVALWATQVVMNGPGGSAATQLLMELQADGSLIDRGSRAIGSFANGGLDSGYNLSMGEEMVARRTQPNVLFVSRYGSQWALLAQFEVSGDRLLLSFLDGDRALWYRQ